MLEIELLICTYSYGVYVRRIINGRKVTSQNDHKVTSRDG